MVRDLQTKVCMDPKRVSIALRVSSRKPLTYKSELDIRITARNSRWTVPALSRRFPNKGSGDLSNAKGVLFTLIY